MIGISIGDANGVGPEILLRAYHENKLSGEFIAIGDYTVLNFCNEKMALSVPLNNTNNLKEFKKGCLNVFNLGILNKEDITIGQISKKTGYASLKYIETGTRLALEKSLHGIVTLPVNKEAVRLSYPNFSGHTGYIASLCRTDNYTMMLFSEQLIVSHVSTHVSYLEAANYVKKERILNVIRLTKSALERLGKGSRIAVAGLNPHAGENDSFGFEDSKEILPAVIMGQNEGLKVTGPVPADTVFYQALKGKYDAVVCMYHDQGHIPLKLLAFDSAVNITLGLPIVRTSVDHGTAFDIAYKGNASITSFINAFNLAKKLSSP
jgi:4-phospho-D-threonate 3-dehydrogenase / 4-phospho-D-erythronate 3-dehydrogenase